jgi:hypothetical protein
MVNVYVEARPKGRVDNSPIDDLSSKTMPTISWPRSKPARSHRVGSEGRPQTAVTRVRTSTTRRIRTIGEPLRDFVHPDPAGAEGLNCAMSIAYGTRCIRAGCPQATWETCQSRNLTRKVEKVHDRLPHLCGDHHDDRLLARVVELI